jgi:hypothetical protein
MTMGPGIPNMDAPGYRKILENSKPGGSMLGDATDWDELLSSQSIIVGSPDTVYRQIMGILDQAQVGTLLIQFHMGNMPDAIARNSMRLFAEQVAPRLRTDSTTLFAREYPELEAVPAE